MEAQFIRHLEGWRGVAELYKLSNPYAYTDGESCEYVIISAVFAYSGPEVLIFPSNENGKPLSWEELNGSQHGTMNHNAALTEFLESA